MRLTLYGDEMTDTTISMDSAIKRYETMKSSSKEKIEVYGEAAWIEVTTPQKIDFWNNAKGTKFGERPATRLFYDLAHSCSIETGLITKSAFLNRRTKGGKYTKDHVYRPQFICRFMLDNHEKFQHFDDFFPWWLMCCSTVIVTPKENDELSIEGTDNRKGKFILKSRTDEQYSKMGLDLYSYSKESRWVNKTIEPVSNMIIVPQELQDYEKQVYGECAI